ncbi:hypothetical protein HWV07_01290 [Natronomonas salina]|uniref:hypothetical protein n=1 Tax=Natronomonas salina TaxID=1710540 RepID=UPI0015B6221D|nr:hypothetical protein [Natronomonas salina]QLD87739.1 hypothetical protein HWV07_01290 [Natronomonas salina]
MTPARGPSARSPGRKSVLFCPTCDHEAPLDGDWSHRDRTDDDGSRTDVTCPECGDLVVSQPRLTTGDGGEGLGGSIRPVLQLLNAVVRHDVL